MKARLINLVVQPVIVPDDGDSLTETRLQPVDVTARDLDELAPETIPALLGQIEEVLSARGSEKSSAPDAH